jgi:hypothetical protein
MTNHINWFVCVVDFDVCALLGSSLYREREGSRAKNTIASEAFEAKMLQDARHYWVLAA